MWLQRVAYHITPLASLLALVVRIADFVRHMLLRFRLPGGRYSETEHSNVWCNSLRVAGFLSVRVCHTVRYRYGHSCMRFCRYSETEHSKRRVKGAPSCIDRILHLLRIDCLFSIVVRDDKSRIPPVPFLETC